MAKIIELEAQIEEVNAKESQSAFNFLEEIARLEQQLSDTKDKADKDL